MPTVTLRHGPTIAYDDTGGSAPALIFSHGLFMSRHMFDPQVAMFSRHWRCITWDERAHGGTQWDGEFTYWDSAKDLLGLMDALGIEKAVHCGMSQGGLLGMRAAILAPDRFYGIIQLATQAGKLTDEAILAFREFTDDWMANGIDAAKIEFLTNLILGPGMDHSLWHRYWGTLQPAQLRSALSALFSIDEMYDRLPEVIVPMATIHGLADAATEVERAMRAHSEVPNPRAMTLIEGGPHAVNLTHPAEVNAAIQSFLETLCREQPDLNALRG